MRRAKGAEFTRLRQRAGLSVEQAAELIEVTPRTIRRYEEGTTEPTRLALRTLSRAKRPDPSSNDSGRWFRFVDLFAGIGGLRYGFEPIGGECVFTSEWDRYSNKTYLANFPDDSHKIEGDIREFSTNPERVPKHDLLLAGFPCQPFSIAGVSKKNALGRPHGFLCDTQGTLFFDTAQIIAHHRPAAFVLENVKNLERHDGGQTFRTILNVLENELGYSVDYKVVSSQAWVPQRRERIFIVGFREQTSFSFDDVEFPDPANGPKLGSILESDPDPKYTLTPHLWKYLQDYRKKHEARGNGFGYSVFGPNDVTRTLSQRYYKDGSEILVSRGEGNIPRRLTPVECARLMGFEDHDRRFKIPVSDTQAYRQFGNAVVVPVVRFVAEQIKPHLEDALGPRRVRLMSTEGASMNG